jgi:ribonucleoside-diphosphate reductase alpha chain
VAIINIRKRDGNLVEFNPEKIHVAIEKAVSAVRGGADKKRLDDLTSYVITSLEKKYQRGGIPEVEEVQDMVEESLMRMNLFDVAKAYILYRERHRQMREARQEGTLKRISEGKMLVRKKNGTVEQFEEKKLRKFIQLACSGYEGVVDSEEILFVVERGIHDGIETSKIADLTITTAKAMVEKDPVYTDITSRLFLNNLYKEVTGQKFSSRSLDGVYRDAFVTNIKNGVTSGLLSPRLLEFDLEKMAEYIDIKRDLLLNDTGLQILYDRYFTKDVDGKERRFETPQMFWMRVSMGLSVNEPEKEKYAAKFYEVLSSLRYVASTPTLFNAGTKFQQLSSCYLTTVEDDLAHIFKCIGDNAQLSKGSGGLGNDWTNLRGTGALIKSTGIRSQGVIPFLKIANDATFAINRSGKRRGATCAYLEAWHFDVEDFIDLRKNTGDERRRTHDMDTALWIPDLFMKRIQNDGEWTLFSSNEVSDLHHIYGKKFEDRYAFYEQQAEKGEIKQFKKMKARDLWRKVITSLFETGHPWITFKDPSNIRSPQDHAGVIHSSNLCTEITLNTSKDETAVCNLGSINIAKHIINGKFDQHMIQETATTAMRMLDNVIDINYYATPEARNSNMRHRPVGLGIMGFQDALYMLNINFDSEEMVKFADESMEIVSYHAIMASSELAKERGAYESFKGSKWDRGIMPVDTLDMLENERGIKIEVPRGGKLDWTPVKESIKQYGMRNSNCLAIAPTATISNISGCYPSIEPIYKAIYVKSNMAGEFTVVNEYLVRDLKDIGMWNKSMLEEIKYRDGTVQDITSIPQEVRNKYKCVFDIGPEWLIKAAAYRGKWMDQSQSLNIFTITTSGKAIADVYSYAWRMGLKTTYYLRSLGASSIEKSTVDVNQWKAIVAGEKVTADALLASQQQVQTVQSGGTEQLQLVTPVVEKSQPITQRIRAASGGQEQSATYSSNVAVSQEGDLCEACQ